MTRRKKFTLAGSFIFLCILKALFFTTTLPELPVEQRQYHTLLTDPLQIQTTCATFNYLPDVVITPIAEYLITARVLSKKHYHGDLKAQISPYDVVFGWGPMSNLDIIDDISIVQRSRWYFWSASEFPISKEAIQQHSANTHCIPATEQIRKQLAAIDEGDIVQLRGYLVDVRVNGQVVWKSSKSREDTGIGACEIFYITSIYSISEN